MEEAKPTEQDKWSDDLVHNETQNLTGSGDPAQVTTPLGKPDSRNSSNEPDHDGRVATVYVDSDGIPWEDESGISNAQSDSGRGVRRMQWRRSIDAETGPNPKKKKKKRQSNKESNPLSDGCAIAIEERGTRNLASGSGTKEPVDPVVGRNSGVNKTNPLKSDKLPESLVIPRTACSPMQMLFLLADEGYTFRSQVYKKRSKFNGHTLHPVWVCIILGDKGGDLRFQGIGGSNHQHHGQAFDFAVFDLAKRAKDHGLDLPGFYKDFYLCVEANLVLYSTNLSKSVWLGFDWEKERDKYVLDENRGREVLFGKLKIQRVNYRQLSLSLKNFEKTHARLGDTEKFGEAGRTKGNEKTGDVSEAKVDQEFGGFDEAKNREGVGEADEEVVGGIGKEGGATGDTVVYQAEKAPTAPARLCRCHLRYQRLKALSDDNGNGLRHFFNIIAFLGITAVMCDIFTLFLHCVDYLFY